MSGNLGTFPVAGCCPCAARDGSATLRIPAHVELFHVQVEVDTLE